MQDENHPMTPIEALLDSDHSEHLRMDRLPTPGSRIGEALVAEGVVTEQQVRQALENQSHTAVFLGQVLVDLGFASAQKVGAHLSRQLGVRYVDLNTIQPEAVAVSLLPEDFIRNAQALPVRLVGDTLEVAMVDPLDIAVIDRIHIATNRRVLPVLTMAGELLRTVNDQFDARSRYHGGAARTAVGPSSWQINRPARERRYLLQTKRQLCAL